MKKSILRRRGPTVRKGHHQQELTVSKYYVTYPLMNAIPPFLTKLTDSPMQEVKQTPTVAGGEPTKQVSPPDNSRDTYV